MSGPRPALSALILIAFAIVFVPLSFAQTTPDLTSDAPSTTIRTQTELVLVPVAVHDKKGTHVTGLAGTDFEVKQDGEPQKIALFEEVVSVPRSRRHHESGEYTNSLADEDSRRLTIILLDMLNTPYLTQGHVRQELLKVLSAGLANDDPKALLALTRSGIVVLHDFTDDPAVLTAALLKAKGDPSALPGVDPISAGLTARAGGDPSALPGTYPNSVALTSTRAQGDPGARPGVDPSSVALTFTRLNLLGTRFNRDWDFVRQRWNIDQTLASLQDLARAFAGMPGRKALIWASAGFPFWNFNASAFPMTPSMASYDKTLQLFNSANIAIYSVDVRGFVVDDRAYWSRDLEAYFRLTDELKEARTTTLCSFAEKTGGKAFVGFGDVAKAFREAFDDSRSYYLLGYYLNATSTKPGWHRLRVKVGRSGTHVRTRAGFLVPKSRDRIETKGTDLALTSPLNHTAVPLTLRLQPPTDVQGRKHVEFALALAPGALTIDSVNGNHAEFEVRIGVVDAQGKIRATKPHILDLHFKPELVARIADAGLVYRDAFEIDSGEYTARFVVRDVLSGRVGSVSAPLNLAP